MGNMHNPNPVPGKRVIITLRPADHPGAEDAELHQLCIRGRDS